jgi:ATP-dependent DNA helicase RecG
MIAAWLNTIEDEHLEFKAAKNNFDRDEVGRYCSALSNVGGGYMVLGITDKVPRQVVGTTAFNGASLAALKNYLFEQLHSITVEAETVSYDGKGITVFSVPAHPLARAVTFKEIAYIRLGESLKPMPQDRLKAILLEDQPDYSSLLQSKASLHRDLSPDALQQFRELWMRKSHRSELATRTVDELLSDAELMRDGHLTNAALILLGTQEAVDRFVPNAEIILEYRAEDNQIESNERISFRQGLLGYLSLVETWLEKRNSMQHFQDGLYVRDVKTFDERSMREAIMNAVAHRDYRQLGSVFVRQYPSRIVVESPGGLPDGVTTNNILTMTAARNRRIAENLERAGLVERSGQGYDMMYGRAILQSKRLPDLAGTNDSTVRLTLDGRVLNPALLRFFEQLGDERTKSLHLEELLVLDILSRDEAIPEPLRPRIPGLRQEGLIEVVGRGRGTRFILSRRLYGAMGKPGKYTRKKGLDKDENKVLIMKHLISSPNGAVIRDLEDVLPNKTRGQMHALLRELVTEGNIAHVGNRRAGKWIAKHR